jgi:hypothetical protein
VTEAASTAAGLGAVAWEWLAGVCGLAALASAFLGC